MTFYTCTGSIVSCSPEIWKTMIAGLRVLSRTGCSSLKTGRQVRFSACFFFGTSNKRGSVRDVRQFLKDTSLEDGKRVPGWEGKTMKPSHLPCAVGTGGRKQANKPLIGDVIDSWYPVTLEDALGGNQYTSVWKERRADKLERLRRRGKGPPRKGEGKRSSKKKK